MKNTLAIFLFIFFASAIQAQDTTIDKGSGWLYFTGVPGTTPSVAAGSEVAINTLTREAYIWNRDSSEWQPWLLIDSVTFLSDTLRIYENGSGTPFEVAISTADGNGLFDAANNNDTIRISTALLRAALNITGGAYGMNITSSSIPFASVSTGTVSGWFNSQNSGTNTFMNVVDVSRATTGTAAAGLGGRIRYILEADNGGTSNAGYLGVKWSSAAVASLSSDFQVRLLGAGTEYDRLTLAGATGQLTLSGYAYTSLTSADSSLYVLTTDETGDVWKTPIDSLGSGGGSDTTSTINRGQSGIFPTISNVLREYQSNIGPGANNMPIEIANYGYSGHGPTDSIHFDNVGLWRLNGRGQFGRNVQWDSLNNKWVTPIKDASAYGSVILELGGEALILHATPHGVNYSDVPHEILLASAGGTDAESAGNKISTGYFVQAKAPLFARYESSAYNPATTAKAWNPSTAETPMLWLSTGEQKGSGGYGNELARLEANSSSAAVYPAFMLKKSGGTLASNTAVTTGQVVGQIAFGGHDGTDYEATAAIEGVTRGTIASNQVPMDIRFTTSATNTASRATRFEIKNDGPVNVVNSSFRIRNTSISSTIPDLSGFTTISPAPDSYTLGTIQHLSTATGGVRFFGLGGNSTASTARAIQFSAILGSNSPTAPAISFQAYKHDGVNNVAALADSEIVLQFRNSGTTIGEMLGRGDLILSAYGSGTITGTHAKSLSVTSSGNVIEVPEKWGSISTSTDGSGDITVAHGMGVTPTSVQVTVTGTTPYVVTVHSIDATNFTVRFYDMTGAAVTSTAVTASWHCK